MALTVQETYTPHELAEIMQDEIGEIATDLEFVTGDPNDPDAVGTYETPIRELLRRMGLTSTAQIDATNVKLALSTAYVIIWERVVAAYVRAYSFGNLQRSVQRSQLFDHAQAMLSNRQRDLTVITNEQNIGEQLRHKTQAVPISIKYPFARIG